MQVSDYVIQYHYIKITGDYLLLYHSYGVEAYEENMKPGALNYLPYHEFQGKKKPPR